MNTNKSHYCYNCNRYFESEEIPVIHKDCKYPQYNFGIVIAGLKELTVEDYIEQNLTPTKAVQYYFPMYTNKFAESVAYDRAYFIGGLFSALRSLYCWYTYNKHWDAYPMESNALNKEPGDIYFKRLYKEENNQFKII